MATAVTAALGAYPEVADVAVIGVPRGRKARKGADRHRGAVPRAGLYSVTSISPTGLPAWHGLGTFHALVRPVFSGIGVDLLGNHHLPHHGHLEQVQWEARVIFVTASGHDLHEYGEQAPRPIRSARLRLWRAS